jgi:hypothetical protein
MLYPTVAKSVSHQRNATYPVGGHRKMKWLFVIMVFISGALAIDAGISHRHAAERRSDILEALSETQVFADCNAVAFKKGADFIRTHLYEEDNASRFECYGWLGLLFSAAGLVASIAKGWRSVQRPAE